MSENNLFPVVINRIASKTTVPFITIATRNKDKILEVERILKIQIIGKDLKVKEIQDEDPIKVLEQKAKDAWIANDGQPILVEDSALLCKALDNLPGPFADQFTNTLEKREVLCRMLDDKDRSVVFHVGIALFDGQETHTHIGQIHGTIAQKPIGTNGFGFDDIFIPEGQSKTYAQMSKEEKDKNSPRRIALELLREKPFQIGKYIFGLPEPYPLQLQAIQKEKLQNTKALQFAYNLECLDGNIPQKDFSNPKRNPYYEIPYANGQIRRYIPQKNTASIGIVLTPWDTGVDLHGKPRRLMTDGFDNPVFWQMQEESSKMALAARTNEFLIHHNEEFYTYIRSLMKKEVKIAPRASKPSPVIDELLTVMKKWPSDIDEETAWNNAIETLNTAAINELGYARMYSQRIMSRTKTAKTGLIVNTTGIPSSVFALGGMPPVTGWRDVLVTAALSFMRSYIPHNNIYAGSPELQLKLFQQAKEEIEKLNLPKDIEAIVIKQIGISVGSEKPTVLAQFAAKAQKAGCSSIRFYTTNPDIRVIESAQAVRQKVGDDMTLCVGPIVDVEQALKLVHENVRVNILLAGHGGGENCTSLAGGGAANSLELLYRMYLDPAFGKTAIGLEGGTGNAIGAILGMVDVISLNKRGVNGGIETGGLFVEHINGRICQPYHGSASPITQWIESALYTDVAKKRLNEAGKLRNVEGKANYMFKRRSVHSIVDNFQEARMFASRALADQDATSISELRQNIKKHGHANHRIISNAAAYVASAHREIK